MRFWWGHTHRAASVGRKAAGSLAKAPRTAEEAAGNSGRWRPPDQSMPFAGGSGRGGHGLERGPRSGLDRAQKAEKASHSHQPHPPWPAQRAGTGPAPSRGQKLRNGEGEGSNFLAPTLTFLTSEQARLKKKKNPLTELCSGSGARTALDPPPATTAFFSASDSSPAERAAAGGSGGGGGGSRGGGGGASRP